MYVHNALIKYVLTFERVTSLTYAHSQVQQVFQLSIMNVHTMLAILNYTYMDIFLKAVNVRNNGGLIKWQFSILSGIDGESLPYNTIQLPVSSRSPKFTFMPQNAKQFSNT